MAKRGDSSKPDVLIPYNSDATDLADASICLIGVRPETNKVSYESVIIKASAPYARVVYLANVCGRIINDKAIVATHYSSQMQFTVNSKDELRKYPEMVARFEEKFATDFENAPIIGSYDAILEFKIKKDAEDLFDTMVPEEFFLELYGQTIKKIGDYYVVNYDIPFVLTRHHVQSDMFVIAVRLKDSNSAGFADINHLIYDRMCENKNLCILDIDKRRSLPWYDQVRRTYHISRSHIEAMFDLTDYVFTPDGSRIDFQQTPLGRRLLEKNILNDDELGEKMNRLKNNPLVYLKKNDGSRRLVNIIKEGRGLQGTEYVERSPDECCRIIDSIDWVKSIIN